MAESNDINRAFNRVNSFIAGGFAAKLDEDLKNTCWKGYTAVGMKMKNGRKVPNCVPEEENLTDDIVSRHASHKIVRVKKGSNFIYRKMTEAPASAFVTPNHPHPTGKTVYAKMSGKDILDRLSKTVKTSASEAYVGSEPTSSSTTDPSNRFVGSDSIRRNYTDATPGQTENIGIAKYSVAKPVVGDAADGPDKVTKTPAHFKEVRKALAGMRESYDLNESFSAGFTLAPFARDYGITVETAFHHHPDVQEQLDDMEEATYKGKTVPLNKPMAGDVKKSKVYVDPDGDGKAKKVNFGDKTLSIKKDQPARKKSYCARSSGQGNLTNKSSANYWSRRAWDC
jgi:hypothetical protein